MRAICYCCYMLTDIAIIAAVENRLFTDDMLAVLLDPKSWNVISSQCAEPHEEPDCPATIHTHAHREILFVLGGSGRFVAYGRCWDYAAGTVFALDSFVPHQLGYALDQPDADHLWVFLHDQLIGYQLDQFRRGTLKRYSHILYTDRTSASFASSIFPPANSSLPDQFREIEMRSGMLALAVAIAREGYLVPVREDTRSFQRRVILTVRNHIAETAGKTTSLDSLARLSGYSKYHFHRLFREHVGMTVHAFVDHSRSEKAAEMQRRGYRKKEIAAALGFSSLSAFSRWQKRMHGRH